MEGQTVIGADDDEEDQITDEPQQIRQKVEVEQPDVFVVPSPLHALLHAQNDVLEEEGAHHDGHHDAFEHEQKEHGWLVEGQDVQHECIHEEGIDEKEKGHQRAQAKVEPKGHHLETSDLCACRVCINVSVNISVNISISIGIGISIGISVSVRVWLSTRVCEYSHR